MKPSAPLIQCLFAALLASLLELMLDSSLSDLRLAQGVALPFYPSLVRLLRLLQDFLFAEGTDNHALWSEKVYHTSILGRIQLFCNFITSKGRLAVNSPGK